MAGKRPGDVEGDEAAKARRKSAKASAKKPSSKRAKAATAGKAAKSAGKSAAGKSAAGKSAAGKRAAGAGKSGAAAAKKTSAKSALGSPAGKRAAAKKTASAGKTAAKRTAGASALPAPRRRPARSSASRRAAARKPASHEALVVKTLDTKTRAPARGAAKKRRRAVKAPANTRPLPKAAKTARARLEARAKSGGSPVLRDGPRTRVVKPTASRPAAGASGGRRPPFRPHALGIRDEHATDRPAIERLLTEAFGREDEAKIVARLRQDGDVVAALVAEYDGAVVGHVAFSRLTASLDGRALFAAALAPLAVAADMRRRGVGASLVAAGLEAARAAGAAAVFVVGDPAYYGRFGFSADSARIFDSPHAGEAFLALELEPGALAGASGNVSFPRALGA